MQQNTYTPPTAPENNTVVITPVAKKTLFGKANRKVTTIFGLAFFFVVVMLCVLIAQRQLNDRSATAPNAPASQPGATVQSCTIQFSVPTPTPTPTPTPGSTPTPTPVPTPVPAPKFECTKLSYANDPRNSDPVKGGAYYLTTQQKAYKPNDIVVFDIEFRNTGTYTIDLRMTDSLNGQNANYLSFMDSNCGDGAYDPATRTLTCDIADVLPADMGISKDLDAPTYHRTFRAKIAGTVPNGTEIVNIARFQAIDISDPDGPGGPGDSVGPIFGGSPTAANSCQVTIIIDNPSASPTPTPTPTPTPPVYQCNSTCLPFTGNGGRDVCTQALGAGYSCVNVNSTDTDTDRDNYRCRLTANPSATSCLPVGATPTPSPTVTPTPTPSPTPNIYSCNGSCQTDEQCQTVNAGYICHKDLKVCRLDINKDSTSCQPAPNTYACNSSCTSNAQCQTANSNYICSNNQCRLDSNPSATNCLAPGYTPPPAAPGCNDTCTTNGDCSNPSHICATTADGSNRCRLADYVNSASCNKPPQTVNTPGTQPTLPQELPQTGFRDIGTWLKAGLAALGVGVALFLLL